MNTSKNDCVDPPRTMPYRILVCLARSSALSMGVTIRSTVKKAAVKTKNVIELVAFYFALPKLAVYDDTRIMEKYHQTPATKRPDIDLPTELRCIHSKRICYLGIKSTPCCMKAARAKKSVFKIENLFDN